MKRIITNLMCVAATLFAATPTIVAEVPSGEIELGKTYTIPAFTEFSATITPTISGTLIQDGGDALQYTDESTSSEVAATSMGYSDNGGMIWNIAVTEGVTYRVSSIGSLNDNTIVWQIAGQGSTEITFNGSVPEQAARIGIMTNTTGDIILNFSTPVIYTSASIAGGMRTYGCMNVNNGFTRTPCVRIADAMREMYRDGAISPDGGNTLAIFVEGIQSADGTLFNNDGKLSLEFISEKKSMAVASVNFAEGQKLLSYYPAGTPEGILKFTFDDNVATDGAYAPKAVLTMGDVSVEGKHVVEDLSVRVEGNTIILDMTGVNRRIPVSAAGLSNGDPIEIKVYNIFDDKHNMAEGYPSSNVGSVSYYFEYGEVPERIITSEFIPANGASLANVEQIEIWFNNADVIQSFDGVMFTYGDGETALIAAEQLVNESTEPDEVLYHVALPAKAKTDAVTVSLANIVSNDGYDKIIEASYNQFVVTYCTPFVNGASMEVVPADPWLTSPDPVRDPSATDEQWEQIVNDFNNTKLVHIRTNYLDLYPEMYVAYEVRNATRDEYVYGSYMTRNSENEFVGTWMGVDYTLIAGNSYTATFYAWADEATGQQDMANKMQTIGKYTVTFYGAGEAFVYSTVKFESITPDPNMGSITPEQRVLTITYDGIVKIKEENSGIALGMGAGSEQFEKVEAVDADPENNGFSSKWALTIPESLMNQSSIDVHVAAYDEFGLTVEGDMATNDASDYKQFSYAIYDSSSLAELTVTPSSGSTVEAISELTIKAAKPLGFNWNCPTPIEIFDKLGTAYTVDRETEVAIVGDVTGTDEETGLPVYDENTYYAVVTLREPITAEGTYNVVIPESYFNVGGQFDVTASAETSVMLTVGTASLTLLTSPSFGDTVESLEEIFVWTSAELDGDCSDVIKLDNDESTAAGWPLEMWDAWNNITKLTAFDDPTVTIGYKLALENGPYTTNGVYTLTIPAGFFVENGQGNSATTVVFNVGQQQPEIGVVLNVSPMNGEVVDEIENVWIWTDAALNIDCEDVIKLESETSRSMFYNLEEWAPYYGITPIADLVDPDKVMGYQLPCLNNGKITANDTYYITIPANFFTKDGEYNEAMVITFTISEGGQVSEPLNLTVSPDPEAADLTEVSEFTIHSAAGIAPVYNEDARLTVSRQANEDDAWEEIVSVNMEMFNPWTENNWLIDDNTVKVILPQVVSLNDYALKLVIPEAFFMDYYGEKTNDYIELIYAKRVGIVSLVPADAEGRFEVYTISGKKVMVTTDANDLKQLTVGLYIINGKKYLLR